MRYRGRWSEARWRFVASLATLAGLTGCDLLLTDPAAPPMTVEVSFQVVGAPLGGPAEAFAKVRRATLRLARSDDTVRDTVFSVTPVGGLIRVPVALDVAERVDALGIAASLGTLTTTLFQGGTVVRIEPGEPISAVVPVEPVPAAVVGPAPMVLIPNLRDPVQISSAVLFASGDTITGLEGTWVSENPQIISITPDGTATAFGFGQTRLAVSYDLFADTIVATTSAVDTIQVSPSDLTLLTGESTQLTATLLDELGNVLLGRAVGWTTLDQAVATVDASGLVSAVRPGTTDIVVTSEDAVTRVPVTVPAF